jgi:hypothetical protein
MNDRIGTCIEQKGPAGHLVVPRQGNRDVVQAAVACREDGSMLEVVSRLFSDAIE